jgi:hypothetical protein
MDKMEEGDGAKGVECGGLQEKNQKEISHTYIQHNRGAAVHLRVGMSNGQASKNIHLLQEG